MSVRIGVVRAVTLVVGSSALGSAIGFFKNILAAAYFGTSGGMDSYLLALLMPDIVASFALTGMFNFIPLFAQARAISEEEGWRAASKMVAYWLVLLVAILLVVVALMPLLVGLLAPGFDPPQRQRTVEMSRVLFLMTASVGAAQILSLPLLAERRFLAASASSIAFQLVSTVFLVVFRSWGMPALVWGMVVGGFAQLLVVAVGLRDLRGRLRLDLDLRAPVVRRMFSLTVPTYIGNLSARLNSVINRGFASLLPTGGISSLQYALTLTEAPVSLLASPANRTLFPYLATQFAEDESRARANLGRALFMLAALFAPIAVGTFLLARPLVRVVFERGAFDARSTEFTVAALQIYAPAILTLALNGLLAEAFNARQNTTVPMRAGILRVALNAGLCFALLPAFGLRGIALSNTLADVAKLVVLVAVLSRLFPREEARGHLRAVVRLVVPLSLMALVVYPASRYLLPATTSWVAATSGLVGVVLVGVAVYGVAFALFCRAEFSHYSSIFRDEAERLRSRFRPLRAGGA